MNGLAVDLTLPFDAGANFGAPVDAVIGLAVECMLKAFE